MRRSSEMRKATWYSLSLTDEVGGGAAGAPQFFQAAAPAAASAPWPPRPPTGSTYISWLRTRFGIAPPTVVTSTGRSSGYRRQGYLQPAPALASVPMQRAATTAEATELAQQVAEAEATELAQQVAEADEEAKAHRQAADAALRLEASQGLEDDGAIQLATGEATETTAQQEYDESAAYADELSAERHLPFPCGVFGCGKRYATCEELQCSPNGKEMGCRGESGEAFGWCAVAPRGSRKRRARSPR